jgi:hypothetical protein
MISTECFCKIVSEDGKIQKVSVGAIWVRVHPYAEAETKGERQSPPARSLLGRLNTAVPTRLQIHVAK